MSKISYILMNMRATTKFFRLSIIVYGFRIIKGGKRVPEGFSYSSENNKYWMKSEELLRWVDANDDKIGLNA